ncbi:unnamed protein product [Didymodactylos carnosus]|uniref:Uncharacterized protein n=1 Tax=Didymodactylos carnosus TaxID=1234261 RepID=A0A814UEH4_9BILA|nr:unnamed protein product [Didymodactylos carnosus]CAF3936382.1 unnamed protein product [Didymodactylos carnosus]
MDFEDLNTQDQSLKESFQLISQSRATICQQLQQMVKQTLGSSLELPTPSSSSSLSAAVTGLLYRCWIDLKSLITGGKDNKTILNEVSRELRTVLQQQLQQIQLQDVGYAKIPLKCEQRRQDFLFLFNQAPKRSFLICVIVK